MVLFSFLHVSISWNDFFPAWSCLKSYNTYRTKCRQVDKMLPWAARGKIISWNASVKVPSSIAILTRESSLRLRDVWVCGNPYYFTVSWCAKLACWLSVFFFYIYPWRKTYHQSHSTPLYHAFSAATLVSGIFSVVFRTCLSTGSSMSAALLSSHCSLLMCVLHPKQPTRCDGWMIARGKHQTPNINWLLKRGVLFTTWDVWSSMLWIQSYEQWMILY